MPPISISTRATSRWVPVQLVVAIESLVVVSLVGIADGASGTVATTGVYELPAVNNAAINQGVKVYYDAIAGKMAPTATDNTLAVVAWAAKLQAGTVVQVRLGQ